MPRPYRSNNARMAAWKPWMIRFGLTRSNVQKHRRIYTLSFAEQIDRCLSDDARRLLLDIKETA
jgi:hypothetical protein